MVIDMGYHHALRETKTIIETRSTSSDFLHSAAFKCPAVLVSLTFVTRGQSILTLLHSNRNKINLMTYSLNTVHCV